MNFELKPLKEICNIQIGKTPSRHENEFWQGGTHAWLSIADMNQGRYLTYTKECITDLGVKTSNIKLIPKNTLVLSYKLSIGKVGITQQPMYSNEAIAALTELDSQVDVNYLYWALQHIDLLENADRAAMGKTLNKAKLNEVKIPIPPLTEQRRIAAILDKADELRQKRQQAIEKLDQLLQATFIDMFGDPVSNPNGWVLFKLSDVCLKITVGIVIKPASYYVESGIPAIRSLNIGVNKIIKEKFVYFSEDDNNSTLKKTKLRAGDVVTVRSGQPGKSAVIGKDMEGCNAIDVLITRTDNSKLLPEFLSFFLNSDAGKQLVMKEQRGQVQKHLNVSQLSEAVVPIPPIELQQRFLANLDKIYSVFDKSSNAKYLINNLFHSLQNQAFNGTL